MPAPVICWPGKVRDLVNNSLAQVNGMLNAGQTYTIMGRGVWPAAYDLATFPIRPYRRRNTLTVAW